MQSAPQHSTMAAHSITLQHRHHTPPPRNTPPPLQSSTSSSPPTTPLSTSPPQKPAHDSFISIDSTYNPPTFDPHHVATTTLQRSLNFAATGPLEGSVGTLIMKFVQEESWMGGRALERSDTISTLSSLTETSAVRISSLGDDHAKGGNGGGGESMKIIEEDEERVEEALMGNPRSLINPPSRVSSLESLNTLSRSTGKLSPPRQEKGEKVKAGDAGGQRPAKQKPKLTICTEKPQTTHVVGFAHGFIQPPYQQHPQQIVQPQQLYQQQQQHPQHMQQPIIPPRRPRGLSEPPLHQPTSTTIPKSKLKSPAHKAWKKLNQKVLNFSSSFPNDSGFVNTSDSSYSSESDFSENEDQRKGSLFFQPRLDSLPRPIPCKPPQTPGTFQGLSFSPITETAPPSLVTAGNLNSEKTNGVFKSAIGFVSGMLKTPKETEFPTTATTSTPQSGTHVSAAQGLSLPYTPPTLERRKISLPQFAQSSSLPTPSPFATFGRQRAPSAPAQPSIAGSIQTPRSGGGPKRNVRFQTETEIIPPTCSEHLHTTTSTGYVADPTLLRPHIPSLPTTPSNDSSPSSSLPRRPQRPPAKDHEDDKVEYVSLGRLPSFHHQREVVHEERKAKTLERDTRVQYNTFISQAGHGVLVEQQQAFARFMDYDSQGYSFGGGEKELEGGESGGGTLGRVKMVLRKMRR
ncbi:hypothetical protein HDV05_006639 [Chytridiales sp. JEL 0842]|nr:hypothetical protein HDV05_006639 [Chytridiales sp. JEL 0842]